ncbi:4-hydroxythreonine-4-phosphate dehydrogenase PdxA [Methylobrevis pamukkalensis]|uniref:4-hydroxythreonine-4-phosphate dehydrogenase n=1 Tax=Methylobrevis pamukkalensis TaxID=1439726 RepID=A0A1E3GZU5_9HYPH|nr:4-hydroxythreonine-4-phosphate dehydrogenase PdxA [Methylobrevis pamukkalensis]ODN69598.1 4-hydroxythreonine-4-phosphate dehydrogenase [Methylobrevis pamukkalensis]
MDGTTRRGGAQTALAMTIGEPAGVGAEIAAMAWRQAEGGNIPPFYLLADSAFVRSRLELAGLDVPVIDATAETCLARFGAGLPVVDVGHALADAPGRPSSADAHGVVASIELAVADVAAGRAGGVVTLPIQKATLYDAGFRHPGHTEFLGELAARHWPGRPATPVMMLAGPELRTVPVTVHIPVSEVPRRLTADLLVETGRIVAADLRTRFGIATPRLAVAGLNPHAGENGSMGREDLDVIVPAIARLVAEGIAATGPWPADTLFHPRARTGYDAVLAMYHDQALIPVKTIAFDETVNVTLGLPFVRTSPDHGTALDIAGTGTARPDSLIAALRMAAGMTADIVAGDHMR